MCMRLEAKSKAKEKRKEFESYFKERFIKKKGENILNPLLT